jgi:hypothetical protein
LPGSKYIYDLYYEKEAISKQLYEWLLKNNYADKNLIAKWKKQGYEKVCYIFMTLPLSPYLPDADCSLLALLSSMHPDQGNQLQQHLHLSRASQAAQGGSSHRVRQLRM